MKDHEQADKIVRWAEQRAQQPMTRIEPGMREEWQIVQASERPNVTLPHLAAEFGLPEPKIQQILDKWTDTVPAAKRVLKAGAVDLAQRFIKDADPAVSLTMFERLGVVPGPSKGNDTGFSVTIGGLNAATDVKLGVMVTRHAETAEQDA